MRQLSIALAGLVVSLVACGDNGSGGPDSRPRPDARPTSDAPPTPDADTTPDAAGVPDANTTPDASNPPDAATGVSAQIQAAIDTPDGTGLTLPITGATITYLKPPIGNLTNDPAGFTVQGDQGGPALFVTVDPATLTPAGAVGDTVSFTITTMGTVGGQHRAQAISGYSRTGTGANVGPLAQNISAATDVVTALDSYDGELIDVTGTAAAAFTSAGNSFVAAQIDTAGITGDANYKLRLPTALATSIDIAAGCQFTLDNTPMNRFNATAEVSAYVAGDIALSNCPAPTVASATALSGTSVRVTFTRNIAPGSVNANGSQFTFDNGLTATAATVSGKDVTVTTTSQSGATYTVTVVNTVTDTLGTALGTPNTATFTGFSTPAVVRINELNGNITGGCDLIELRVVSAGSMAGFHIQERTGTAANQEMNMMFGALTVAKNDIVVVHTNSTSATCNPGGASTETTSIVEQPSVTFAGNYDTAYDWWNDDNGVTATDNVITLYDAGGQIMDALFVSDDPTGTAAAGTETQAAAVGTANQWSPAMTTYIDDVFNGVAVQDLNGTATDALGTSIQRLDNTDDNDVGDWTTGAGSAQTYGLINVGQTPF